MTRYDFTLRFSLPEGGEAMEARLERLAEAGCDDAVVGVGYAGRIALAFSRECGDAADAVLSAFGDAMRAMPDAELIEASPDLVGLTDLAAIMGFTRQNMRKVMGGTRSPSPAHEGKPSLWHLADVLPWLEARGYATDAELLRLSEVALQLNLAVGCAHADAALQRRIRAVARL